jgi:hypothetical protein
MRYLDNDIDQQEVESAEDADRCTDPESDHFYHSLSSTISPIIE